MVIYDHVILDHNTLQLAKLSNAVLHTPKLNKYLQKLSFCKMIMLFYVV